MPKCPECHQEIDHLNATVVERNLYSYSGDRSGYEFREQFEFEVVVWRCPECHKELVIEDPDEFLSKKD